MRRTWQRNDEHGLAIIYLGLFLTVLMIMAALVVDIGNARQQRANAQAAVDSSALSGAQVLDTKAASQTSQVFDQAGNTALETILGSFTRFDSVNGPNKPTSCVPAPAGSAMVPAAVCWDYAPTVSGVTYDVRVTTPFIGPGEVKPDLTLLNVKACWSVPTTFARVIGTKSLQLCAAATAQNGVGQGGPSNGGCGAANELTKISALNNAMGAPGSQTISAEYKAGANGGALDLGPMVAGVNTQNDIHFVVQTQFGNFIQLAKGQYTLTDKSGGQWTDVVISYTLPNTINAATDGDNDDRYSPGSRNYSTDGDNDDIAAYTHTFSANLQVIDSLGQNCGSASWSTCNPQGHDPIFDGGNSSELSNSNGDPVGWGVGWPAGSNSNATYDDLADNDGSDLNTAADSDDTVMPGLGTLVTAGTPIGAIYNDEQPLRKASVSFVIDGKPLSQSSNFAPGTFSFVDPGGVWKTSLATKPTTLTSSAYGVVANNNSYALTVDNTSRNASPPGPLPLPPNTIMLILQDAMWNPMPGEQVTSIVSNPAGFNPVAPASPTRPDGTTTNIALPPKPSGTVTYTVNYAPVAGAPPGEGSGSFTFQVTWSGGNMSSWSPQDAPWQGGNAPPDTWPAVSNADLNTGGTDQSLQAGSSVGIMYNSGGATLVNGWHSAVLFANDGDVTSGGGDCSIITWAFASTGGAPGPGTLHLIT